MSECTEQNSSPKYKGVRKRKWGKWVSEIRLPNSRERIWLGSFDSPEKAARAFDVALYCLRGPGANFNFPDNPPEIPGGRSLTPPEIQVVANRFANNEEFVPPRQQRPVDISARGEIENGGGPTSLSDQQVANNNNSFTNSNSNNVKRTTATTAADWSSSPSSSFVFESGHHVAGPSLSTTTEFGYFPGLDNDDQQYYNLFFPTTQDNNNDYSSLSGFHDDVGYYYEDFLHHDSFNLWNFHEDFSGRDEF